LTPPGLRYEPETTCPSGECLRIIWHAVADGCGSKRNTMNAEIELLRREVQSLNKRVTYLEARGFPALDEAVNRGLRNLIDRIALVERELKDHCAAIDRLRRFH
jgi:hypothetical protein